MDGVPGEMYPSSTREGTYSRNIGELTYTLCMGAELTFYDFKSGALTYGCRAPWRAPGRQEEARRTRSTVDLFISRQLTREQGGYQRGWGRRGGLFTNDKIVNLSAPAPHFTSRVTTERSLSGASRGPPGARG